jgi:hypothetical protein
MLQARAAVHAKSAQLALFQKKGVSWICQLADVSHWLVHQKWRQCLILSHFLIILHFISLYYLDYPLMIFHDYSLLANPRSEVCFVFSGHCLRSSECNL